MNIERKCQFCKFYKDGYCENLELKPCYPQKGCDDFSERNEVKIELNMTKLIDEIKEVTQAFNELVDNLERIEKKYNDGLSSEDRESEKENEVKDLSKRVETLEKQMKEDKEEQLKKLKAELDYAKFRCALQCRK